MGDLGLIRGLGRSSGEVFWPGEFHGLYGPWGHKESDTTERLSQFRSGSVNFLSKAICVNGG